MVGESELSFNNSLSLFALIHSFFKELWIFLKKEKG
jgi:hypothetical protein